jgi:hypothetical protein
VNPQVLYGNTVLGSASAAERAASGDVALVCTSAAWAEDVLQVIFAAWGKPESSSDKLTRVCSVHGGCEHQEVGTTYTAFEIYHVPNIHDVKKSNMSTRNSYVSDAPTQDDIYT